MSQHNLRMEERYAVASRAFYYPAKNTEGESIGWTLRPEFGRRPIGQGVTQDEARDDFVRQIQEEMEKNHR